MDLSTYHAARPHSIIYPQAHDNPTYCKIKRDTRFKYTVGKKRAKRDISNVMGYVARRKTRQSSISTQKLTQLACKQVDAAHHERLKATSTTDLPKSTFVAGQAILVM